MDSTHERGDFDMHYNQTSGVYEHVDLAKKISCGISYESYGFICDNYLRI